MDDGVMWIFFVLFSGLILFHSEHLFVDYLSGPFLYPQLSATDSGFLGHLSGKMLGWSGLLW